MKVGQDTVALGGTSISMEDILEQKEVVTSKFNLNRRSTYSALFDPLSRPAPILDEILADSYSNAMVEEKSREWARLQPSVEEDLTPPRAKFDLPLNGLLPYEREAEEVACSTCRAAKRTCTARACMICYDRFEELDERPTADGKYIVPEPTSEETLEKARELVKEEIVGRVRLRPAIQERRNGRPACFKSFPDRFYNACGHSACVECLIRHFETFMNCKDGSAAPPSCCQKTVSISYLKPYVSRAFVSEYYSALAFYEDKKPLYCPKPTCSTYVPRATYHKLYQYGKYDHPLPLTKDESEKAEETGPVEEAPKSEDMVRVPSIAGSFTSSNDSEGSTASNDSASTAATSVATTDGLTDAESLAILEAATAKANVLAAEAALEEAKPIEPVHTRKSYHTYKRSRLALCPDSDCLTAICTLCKEHFHGLTPCINNPTTMHAYLLVDDGEGAEADDEDEHEAYPLRTVQCLRCDNLISRRGGCNHIICHCGAQFCFNCGSKWKDGGNGDLHYDCPYSWEEEVGVEGEDGEEEKVVAKLVVGVDGMDSYGNKCRETVVKMKIPLEDEEEERRVMEQIVSLVDGTRWMVKEEEPQEEVKEKFDDNSAFSWMRIGRRELAFCSR